MVEGFGAYGGLVVMSLSIKRLNLLNVLNPLNVFLWVY